MKYVLNVPDISCNHCKMRISKALDELGIKDYEVSVEEKKVIVETEDLDSVLKNSRKSTIRWRVIRKPES